jgi:8-oxo-dGTP pyrophosphatase MutT (NUDIX family)
MVERAEPVTGRTSSRDVLAQLSMSMPESLARRLPIDHDPVVPHPAATVVLLRDHEGAVQTYALHRHSRMAFAPGMVVFPGGRVDPVDGEPAADADLADPALLACAIRETAEETGVRLGAEMLRPWAHWITPEIEPRRYDTAFYLAALPAEQEARDISGETTMAEWRTPGQLLTAADRGEIALMPPTRSVLLELVDRTSVAHALAAAADRLIETVMPQAVHGQDGWSWTWGGR